MKDLLGAILDYEEGVLDQPATIRLFQDLIDIGLAWKLQGCYGRQAKAFIEAGLCNE